MPLSERPKISTATLGASIARTVPTDIAASDQISTFRRPAWSLYLARTTPVIPPSRKNMVCEIATRSGVGSELARDLRHGGSHHRRVQLVGDHAEEQRRQGDPCFHGFGGNERIRRGFGRRHD